MALRSSSGTAAPSQQMTLPLGVPCGAELPPGDGGLAVRQDVGPSEPYTYAALPKISDDPGSLYLPTSGKQIIRLALSTLKIEAPIHRDELIRRVIASFGLQKLSAKAAARMDEVLGPLFAGGEATLRCDFVWPRAVVPEEYARFRGRASDGRTRPMELVPPEEIANAAGWILKQVASLERAELIRETARLFGIARSGKTMVAGVDTAIELLVGRRACELVGPRIVWIGTRR